MAELFNTAIWARYESLINDMHDTFNQETVIWRRLASNLDRYGETNQDVFQDIELKALLSYNFFRTWPINQETPSGELDKQSVVMILNMQYLRDNHWVNDLDLFDFRPDQDRFIIKGVTYRADGDTDMAQAHDKSILTQIILKRQKPNTGDDVYREMPIAGIGTIVIGSTFIIT